MFRNRKHPYSGTGAFVGRPGTSLVVPSGPASLAEIPNLALWLDADDASTLTLSGVSVDEWRDKSGNGRDFTGVGSARPSLVTAAYNGRDAIEFDGVDDALTLGASGLGRNVDGVTLYVVMRFTVAPTKPAEGPFVWVRSGGAATRFGAGGGTWGGPTSGHQKIGGRRLDTDVFDRAETADVVDTSWRTVCGVFAYSTAELSQYINGVLDGYKAPFQTAGATSDTDSASANLGGDIGSGLYAAVEITEILVYHAAHDASARAQVEAYLTR